MEISNYKLDFFVTWDFDFFQGMAALGRLFDPSPHHTRENGELFVFSFLQPRESRKISYREQQELLRISLEEHPEFNKQGIILDTIEKGVNYPVIHVLRISEEAEKESEMNKQKNAKSSIVKLAKPLSLQEPKSMAFVDGCDEHPDKSRNVQIASIKLHKSNELGSDVYLMQG